MIDGITVRVMYDLTPEVYMPGKRGGLFAYDYRTGEQLSTSCMRDRGTATRAIVVPMSVVLFFDNKLRLKGLA
eukprot:g8799.t1